MGIIEVLIILCVVGVALYLINTYVPMARPLKVTINVIVVLVLVIWLLHLFGLINFPSSFRIH